MESCSRQLPAPGLERGVRVLRLLEDGREATLEQLARATGYPKSSLLRLLMTLGAMGLTARDEASKRYFARERLIPLRHADADLPARLDTALAALSACLGSTAEWWVPARGGMVLIKRSEPPAGGAQVLARPGFERPWDHEFEAVVCVGAAWHDEAPQRPGPKSYIFVADGVARRLSRAEFARRIALARQAGWAEDAHFNHNGVRRAACAVLHNDRFMGALAVAQCYRPGADSGGASVLQTLIQQAQPLCSHSSFHFQTK